MARTTAAARRLLLTAALLAALVACNEESGDDRSPASPAAGAAADLAELPVPRTEVSGAAWAGGLIVAGGLTPDGAASALAHTFDADRNRWQEAPQLPVPLHHAGMAVIGDRVYVAGGFTNGPGQPWQARAEVWSLAAGEPAWREEAALPGGPRGALGLAATATRLVAVGGVTADGAAVATTEVYDVDTGEWRSGPNLALAREHLAVAAKGDRVYAVAGRAGGLGNFTAVESLDPASDRAWRTEPDLADSRGGIAAATVDGRLCVAGGEEAAGTIASVECLDGDDWTRAARLEKPRHGLAVMALDGRLHVVAGGEQPGLFVSGVHEALEV